MKNNYSNHRFMHDRFRKVLNRLGLPDSDAFSMPQSKNTFDDGGHYRIEIPTINSLSAMRTVIKESENHGIQVNRITETFGMFRHTKSDIVKMVKLCESYGCQLIMSTGPRAQYDTSPTAKSLEGKSISYRLRGQEQLLRAMSDIFRGIDLGVKGFLIYDEGLLSILNMMRLNGELPSEIHFKVSAHCGYANAASLKILENIGANSVNPVRDLTLPMISAIRSHVKIPLDIHTDNPVNSGGFIRTYEAPEIVRIASPVYLKAGNSSIAGHGMHTSEGEAKRMVNQAAIIKEFVSNFYPESIQSESRETECVEY